MVVERVSFNQTFPGLGWDPKISMIVEVATIHFVIVVG